MYGQSWVITDYMLALRDVLRARPGLDDVQVMSAPIANDLLEHKAVAFIDALGDEESAAMGDRRRREETIIECVIQVLEPGSGEAAAVAGRNEAVRIMSEIEQAINDDPYVGMNTTYQRIRMSEITRKNLRQAYQDNFRRVVVEFDITVKATTSPKNII